MFIREMAIRFVMIEVGQNNFFDHDVSAAEKAEFVRVFLSVINDANFLPQFSLLISVKDEVGAKDYLMSAMKSAFSRREREPVTLVIGGLFVVLGASFLGPMSVFKKLSLQKFALMFFLPSFQ